MASKDYFSKLIHQTYEGDTSDAEILDEAMLTLPSQESEMLDLIPFPTVYPSSDCFLRVINTHTYDPDFVSPNCLILLKHLLVVLHWPLTGSTPSSPNIHQQDLSSLMLEMSLPLIKNVINFPIISKGTSSR